MKICISASIYPRNRRKVQELGKEFPPVTPKPGAYDLTSQFLASATIAVKTTYDVHRKLSFMNPNWYESCSVIFGDGFDSQKLGYREGQQNVVTIRSGQKLFTEDEVSRLTGICLDHLRSWAQSKHVGSLIRAAEAAGAEAEKCLFSDSDLMILNVLCPRCEH